MRDADGSSAMTSGAKECVDCDHPPYHVALLSPLPTSVKRCRFAGERVAMVGGARRASSSASDE
jgi:hypothetical protein